MSATPLWFGPLERPLFGWLHVPDDGVVRGGAVLCPPVGYEAICAHRTFRVVAEELAQRGIAALRFDYDGTGDSAGDDLDPDRVDAWARSVGVAIALLRDTGAPSVAGVGMRLGTTLAALHAPDLDALVLWDPVWSGRTLLRQMRALQLLGVANAGEARDDGSMSVAGTVFSGSTVESLRSLKLPDLRSYERPVLALVRADAKVESDVLPAHAVVGEATAQDGLLDGPSMHAKVPWDATHRVVEWVAGAVARDARAFGAPTSIAGPLGETFLSLGPVGLFGVLTPGDPTKPTITLLNNSIDHHIGPSRMWVDWGRSIAARGFPVARVDISGVGDSPTRPGQPFDRPYPVHAVEDVVDMVRALEHGSGVIVGGLCSGGRNAVDAADVADVRGVLAINPPLHTTRAVIERMSTEDPDPASLVEANRHRPIVSRLTAWTPAPVWRVLHGARVVRSHADSLASIAKRGTDTLLLYGTDDFFGSIVKRKSRWHLDVLSARHEHFRTLDLDALDHGLMGWKAREDVADALTEHVLARYGTRATTWNQSTSDTSSPSDTLRPSSRA